MVLKIAIAQLDPTVGAIADNARAAAEAIASARGKGADLVIIPEMFITGYPTNDLLYEEGFVEENERALREIVAPATQGIAAIVGFVKQAAENPARLPDAPTLCNCAAVISNGRRIACVSKTLLPNYDVFDEKRYFIPAREQDISPVRVKIRGRQFRIGIQICEDLWDDNYPTKVTRLLYERGSDFIVNISSSPFHIGKGAERERLVLDKVAECPIPFVYANMVGGQDELVFDGRSFAAGSDGKIIARAAAFEQEICQFELDTTTWTAPEAPAPPYSKEEEILKAHILNLRDYFNKQKFFKGIVIGMSGGIDSAYTAYVAAQAIGPENVLCVAMPSKFTASVSLDDAEACCRNIGVRYEVVSIKDMYEAGLRAFESTFGVTPFGIAEENDQPRCRMMILMKLSQKYSYLVCTTGNKSELSTGYFTTFGDGAGGKNVPGDLYKTELYDVVRYINRNGEIIPNSIIERPPTAELKEDQKDTDSLPPYPVLDPILRLIVEEHMSRGQLVSRGFDEALVDKVFGLYKKTEFKRAQLPLGIKITKKAYGVGRRIPITNHWNG